MKPEQVQINISFWESFKFGMGFSAGLFFWALILLIMILLFVGSIFSRSMFG